MESPADESSLSPTVVALYGIWAHWADRDDTDIPVHIGAAERSRVRRSFACDAPDATLDVQPTRSHSHAHQPTGTPGFLSFAMSCPDLISPPRFTLSDAGAVFDLVADGADGLNMEDFVAALQTLAVERFPHDGTWLA